MPAARVLPGNRGLEPCSQAAETDRAVKFRTDRTDSPTAAAAKVLMSDDPIRIMCPSLSCRKVLAVPSNARGKSVRCRNCGTVIRVPTQPGAGRRKKADQLDRDNDAA